AKAKETEPTTQKSGVKSQESGVKTQKSGVKSQESGVKTKEAGKNKSKKNSNQPLPLIPDLSPEEEETVLEFTNQGHVQRQRPTTEQKSTRTRKIGNDFIV